MFIEHITFRHRERDADRKRRVRGNGITTRRLLYAAHPAPKLDANALRNIPYQGAAQSTTRLDLRRFRMSFFNKK